MNRIVVSLLGSAIGAGLALAAASAQAQILPPPPPPPPDMLLPIGWGQVDDGRWVENYEGAFADGESSGWHYHPGPVTVVVLSGTLTEDHGCGAPLETHATGDAFIEPPGVVHNVVATGYSAIAVSGVLPQCWGDAGQFNDFIPIDGPHCIGRTHHARREPVGCP